MAIASVVQSDFSVGEIAPELQSSVGFDKYRKAVAKLLNWIPTLQGDLVRRPGTQFISEVKDSAAAFAPRMLPFVFSTSQSYALEWGDKYMRAFSNRARLFNASTAITGITKASPAVVTSPAHKLITGQTVFIQNVAGMTQVNNSTTGYAITVLTANTFSLNGVNSTGFGAYTSGGTVLAIYEIVTPYALADVDLLQVVQSADTMFIAHPNYPPGKLVRQADGSFAYSVIDIIDGPYLDTNTTSTQTGLNGGTVNVGDSVFIDATAPIFSASTDVGRLFRFSGPAVFGYLKITSFVNTQRVIATVKESPGSGAATKGWRLGAWYTGNYPSCVEIHEGRLWWSGTLNSPDTYYSSVSSDFENYQPSLPSGTVQDTDAVTVTLGSGDVEQALWMKSTQRGLLTGTRGAEHLIQPGSTSDFIKPSSVQARRQTTYGSTAVAPISVGRCVLYIQRSGLKVRETQYYFSVDGFEAEDLTILSRHITESGVKETAFTRDPFPVLWCVRNDGVLAACTYERDQQVLRAGWSRHQLGGVSTAAGDPAVVERVTSIPNTFTSITWGLNYAYDELWMVSRRLVNGVQRRYVEVLAPPYLGGSTTTNYVTPMLAFNVDAGQALNNGFFISGVTRALPCVATLSAPPTFAIGSNVFVDGVAGMSQLNGKVYQVANIAGNNVTLSDTSGNPIDSRAFSPFLSGGLGAFLGLMFAQVSSLNINSNFESNYLEGETLSVLANGGAQTSVVTAGVIAVSPDAGSFTWGYPFNSDLQMLRQEVGSSNGTSAGKTQRTHKVAVRRYLEGGLQIGLDFTTMEMLDELKRPPPGVGAPLFSGWTIKAPKNTTPNRDEAICFRVSGPLPATITAVSLQIETQDAL